MKTSSRTPFAGVPAYAGLALFSLAAIGGLDAQETPTSTPAPAPVRSSSAEESDDDVVQLEALEVTGSRIRRIDAEPISPVTQLDAGNIEISAFPSIGDALRALPFNNGQAITPTDSGTSFTPGASTINLRGFGNNQTLVLINGRRAVPYSTPGFNGLQTMFDYNSIPEAAIDRVEILKDGGSAIYGSDAVGGVVNFIMKRNFVGLSTDFEIGNYFDTDGLQLKGSVAVGTVSAKTSITFMADWKEQKAVFARELDYTAEADKSNLAHRSNPRYAVDGFEAAGFDSEEAYLADTLPLIGFTDPISDGWFDNSSSRGFPGYVDVPDGEGDFTSFTYDAPTGTPTLANAVEGVNFYNFQATAGLLPKIRRMGFFTTVRHDFSDQLYGRLDVMFNRVFSRNYAAATPADLEDSQGLSVGTQMTIPDYNEFNPFGVDLTSGRRRMVELPNRVNAVTADTPHLVVGLGGKISWLEANDWTWEANVQYSKNSVNSVETGYVADYKLQQALNGLTRLGNGSLAWDPNTPLAEREYFNWFGLNEPAMSDFIGIENNTSDALEYRLYDATATGKVFDFPAGAVQLAVGAEHRKEDFESIRSDLNATAMIVGGSEGTSAFGRRNLTAIYAEAEIPLIKGLEVQLAGRYEDYSDAGIKSEVRPKVGFKYRPFEWLLLRGSYAESFKAPDLAYLYTTAQSSISSTNVIDPKYNELINGLEIVTAGNPNLEPETTDQYFIGAVLEAPDQSPLRGFEFSIEYFSWDQTNLLAQLSDFYGYEQFLDGEISGDALFQGKVVRDPVTDRVVYIRDDYANISFSEQDNIDFSINYRRTTERWGSFTLGGQATLITKLSLDGDDDIVGSYLTSKWNFNNWLGWERGDWGVNLYGVYHGTRRNDIFLGTIYTDDDALYLRYDVKPQYVLNGAVTFRGWEHTRVTVGLNNIFNTAPPVDPFDVTGTTTGVNDPYPAYWYVRLSRDF